MMKYFIIVFILISTLGVNAQTLTKTDVLGVYTVAKWSYPAKKGTECPDGCLYIASTEKPKVDKALANLKRTNPAYTAMDSSQAVFNASIGYAIHAPLLYTYKADGTMELSTILFGGIGKPEIGKWVFNAAKQQITLTYDYDKSIDVLTIEKRGGKIYLIQKTADGATTEFIKK